MSYDNLRALAKVSGVDLPSLEFGKKEKSKAIDDLMHWLRNKQLKGRDIDETDLRALANLIAMNLPNLNLAKRKRRKQ
jgi:hypothetical protein